MKPNLLKEWMSEIGNAYIYQKCLYILIKKLRAVGSSRAAVECHDETVDSTIRL